MGPKLNLQELDELNGTTESVSELAGQMDENEVQDFGGIEASKKQAEQEKAVKERFAQLDAQAKEAARKRAEFYASYHHDRNADRKADLERVQREAEAERRRAYSDLDEDGLRKKFARTNPESVEDKAMLVALSEVIDEMNGKFRRPARRVLKSEGMRPMLTPDEVNSLYLKQVRPSTDTTVSLDTPIQERDATISKINAILDLMEQKRLEQEAREKLPQPKPRTTLKQYFFRSVLFVLRHPLNFAIRFMTAYRQTKYQYKNGTYRR